MQTINDRMPLSNDWNRERLATLKQLMPDLFTQEGRLNPDELKKLIDPELVHETERYEFRWFGKSHAKRTAFAPSNATFVYDEHRSLSPTDTKNLIIESENLEALKLLSTGYCNRIKCIYIDPPYNTGKDFVYSDYFDQDRKAYWEDAGATENGIKIDTNTETDGRYHSNWLNMMYSRLLIARQLLREDGVIFISIDDNEVHHLRKLCDEVFGEENFVSDIIWHSKYTTSNDAKYVSRQHEHIILYAKQLNDFEIGLLDRTEDMDNAYKNPDNDPKGEWKATPLHAKSGNESNNYTLKFDNGKSWSPPKGRYPRYSKTRLMEIYKEGGLYFNKSGGIDRKTYLAEVKQGKTTGSVWSFNDVGSSHQANEQLADLLEKGMFDNPKPINLVKTCIKIANGEDSLILDFFGGSGTTGQAVAELNLADGGNRKYILVQLPEATDVSSEAHKAGFKKISDITIERNRRVIQKIARETAAKTTEIQDLEDKKAALLQEIATAKASAPPRLLADEVESKAEQKQQATLEAMSEKILKLQTEVMRAEQLDKGFKVFRLQQSNFPRVMFEPLPDNTEAENIALFETYLRDKEAQLVTAFNYAELITEIVLKRGFDLNYTVTEQPQYEANRIVLATDGIQSVLICLDQKMEDATVAHFKKHTSERFICLERALNDTHKWNLKHYLKENFVAF